ncbi:MAG: hypothetical protein WAN16_11420 [Chthoniobacterales bacterium]
MNPTDTPRTDACPHCGAERYVFAEAFHDSDGNPQWRNITRHKCGSTAENKAAICFEREYRKKAEAAVERLKDRLNDCLSFVALHGPVGATPDTAKLLEVRILATLNHTDK